MSTNAPNLHVQSPSTPNNSEAASGESDDWHQLPNTRDSLPTIPLSPLTPRDYAQSVFEHSQTTARNSLYQGQSYTRLAALLQSALYTYSPRSRANNNSSPIQDSRRPNDGDFLWYYRLDGKTPTLTAKTSVPDLRRDSGAEPGGTLLFLRGYPSWKALIELGSTLKIDPEFYHRHLGFLHIGKESEPIWSLDLPTRQSRIFHTTITSVGRQDAAGRLSLVGKRSTAEKQMQNYLQDLKRANGWGVGDSIVRAISIHDEEEFSIDQAITVYVSNGDSASSSEPWTVMIWLDSARDLSNSPLGPWLQSREDAIKTSFQPVNLHKPGIALRHHRMPEIQICSEGSELKLFQSLSLLPKLYGQSLWPTVMQKDAFYTLHELFAFIASSELEFLTAIATKLEICVVERLNADEGSTLRTQKNLSYYRHILGKHYARTRDTLDYITNHGTLPWPKSDDEETRVAATRLKRDFQYLLTQTGLLQERCDGEMDILTHDAALAEARRSLEQGLRTTRLTVLATFFVPLAFTSSLFSMSFVSFPSNTQGLWVWAVVSVPTLLLSLLIVTWDKALVLRVLQSAQQAIWR